MLRIAVIALLAVNILLIGLELLKPPPAPSAAQTALDAQIERRAGRSDLPEIQLMSEALAARSGSEQLLRCFSLGPFEQGPVFEAMLARIDGLNGNRSRGWADVRETSAMIERGYWVFIPPAENIDLAYAASRGLKAAGIDGEVEVITDGEWVNAVSLGFFDLRDVARERTDSLEAAGFAPRVLVRRDLETRYWLDYEPGAVPDDIPALAGAPGVYNRSLPCPQRRDQDAPIGLPRSPMAAGPEWQLQPLGPNVNTETLPAPGSELPGSNPNSASP